MATVSRAGLELGDCLGKEKISRTFNAKHSQIEQVCIIYIDSRGTQRFAVERPQIAPDRQLHISTPAPRWCLPMPPRGY
jgi:hypothetical protein